MPFMKNPANMSVTQMFTCISYVHLRNILHISMKVGNMKHISNIYILFSHRFSSLEQRSGRGIVLHPVSALASVSAKVKFCVRSLGTSLFANTMMCLVPFWNGDIYWFLRCL